MKAKTLLCHPGSTQVPGTWQALDRQARRLELPRGAPQPTDSFSVAHPEQPGHVWEMLKIREGRQIQAQMLSPLLVGIAWQGFSCFFNLVWVNHF